MSTAGLAIPEAALRHCRLVARRRARNFYYGLKLLPEPKRSALYAIYAWMREADDITDSCGGRSGNRAAALDAFRQRTDEAIAGRPADEHPIWPALAYAAERFGLPAAPFHELLQGQLDDVRTDHYACFEDLLVYCRRVASTVGVLCIEVWGYDDPAAPDLAADRGIAFQLTNIIRDFAQDYHGGRVYLPQEDFDASGLTPPALRAWAQPQACRDFFMHQIGRAVSYYERSGALEGMIHEDCRPTLWAMTSIYRGLLDKAREDPARLVLGRRLRLSSFAKAAIALRARMMAGARREGGNGRP